MNHPQLYTVGFGGSWDRQWRNQHFDNLGDAWKFAGEKLQEIQKQGDEQRVEFRTFTKRDEERDSSDITLRNVKKDGTIGKWDYTVRVTAIGKPCDYWGCTTCQKYVQGKLYQRNGELA